MSIEKILLIVLLVAVIAVAAYLVLSPVTSAVRDQINGETGMGGLAVDYVAAQMTQAAYTPTLGTPPPSAADVASTLAAIAQDAESTRQADARLADALQATQEAHDRSVQATEDARAANERATQIAQVTATQEYWAGVYWAATSTSAWEQTATSVPPTQTAYAWTETAIPMIATNNANVAFAQQTVVVGQARQVDMAVKRQQWAGTGNTILVWFVLTAAVGIIAYFVREMKRVRKMTPDGTVYLLDNGKAGQHVVSSELMPAPVTSIGPDGVVPAGMTPWQQGVTERAQKVRALQAASAAQQPRQMFDIASEIMAGQSPRFAVSAPPPELTDPDTLRVLEADWKDANA